MKKYKIIQLVFLMLVFSTVQAQLTDKKPLDFSVYDDWKSLENSRIYDNGKWISYELNPQYGDGKLIVRKPDSTKFYEITRGYDLVFSPNSDFVVFKIKPQNDTIRKLKLAKTKKDKLPKDSLGILVLNEDSVRKIKSVKSFKLAKEYSSWMAYHLEKEIHKKAIEKKDTVKNKDKKIHKKKKKLKGSDFVIYNPVKDKKYLFHYIDEYAISKNGNLISFIQITNDSIKKSTVFIFDTKNEKLDSLESRDGVSKNITVNNIGSQIAFIHSADTAKTKVFSLYYYNIKTKIANQLVDTLTNEIPNKWTVCEYKKMNFSDDDTKLYFGTAPKPQVEPKDTLLDEDKVRLDIWHWQDPQLQSQQLAQLKKEKIRSFLAVYHIDKNKIVQIADSLMPEVYTRLKGNLNYAYGRSFIPYQRSASWEYPAYRDIYFIDLMTGSRELVKRKIQSYITLSSSGKYWLWFENKDSCWYSYSTQQKKTVNLTAGINADFYDKSHDYPYSPPPYYIAGWTKNDKYVLIYDKYDIWKIDPNGIEKPVNMTNGYGRTNNLKFRYLKLDKEAMFIEPSENLFLQTFNYKTKQAGFYTALVNSKKDPVKLILDDYHFTGVKKSQDSKKLIWQKCSFTEYPNLWISDLDISNKQKITNVNPQQKNYNWGTVDEISWNDFNGDKSHGLLYKPENFDSTKKYPVIVYFYRKHTDRRHYYYSPRPSRSIINPTFYVSNGYLVFMPDIKYKTGYPGESAYNSVVSGTNYLTYKNYVDKENIGIQGQSWGGYQIAYLVSRTDMFKAASPGAPVTNMTSAYGAIRWTSGKSRMFQYEQSQSRIGATLWEKPLQYIENSPIFYVPKINTPLLIRHDDADGSVPWYQGIELFVALRRLNKPAWLLNYNGAPHNLTKKRANQKDWSKRMFQYFNYYLKNKPAPVWLKEGIPAIKKGKTMGFDYLD